MRNLGLDLVRLVAVVLVIGRHLFLSPESNSFLLFVRTGGWIGVDLFFVLSGFLISGLLFTEHKRTRDLGLRRFLLRRALKIYPAFYVMLLFTLAVSLLFDQPLPVRGILAEVFFVQNYLGGLWDHTWSLAVEEHFYLGIAVLFGVLLKKHRGSANPFTAIPGIFFAVAAFCQIGRVVNLMVFDEYSHIRFLYGTHFRMDSLMFGVYLSYLWHYRNLRKLTDGLGTPFLLIAGLVLLIPAFLFPLEQHMAVSVYGVVAFYIGSGSVIIAAVRLEGSSNRLLMVLGSVGSASYSIYLWHLPTMIWGWWLLMSSTGIDDLIIYIAFCLAGSILVGILMSRVVEWPVLKLREKILPSGRAPSVPITVSGS